MDRLLADLPDEAVGALVADVGGHDLPSILEAFQAIGTRFLQMPLGEVERVDLPLI